MTARDLEVLDEWRQGRLSEAAIEQLHERLCSEAALRAALREMAEIEEFLSAQALASASEPMMQKVAEPRSRVAAWQRWLPWVIAAAACVMAMLARWPAGP